MIWKENVNISSWNVFYFLILLLLNSGDEYLSFFYFIKIFLSRWFMRMCDLVELDEIFVFLLKIVWNEGKIG